MAYIYNREITYTIYMYGDMHSYMYTCTSVHTYVCMYVMCTHMLWLYLKLHVDAKE